MNGHPRRPPTARSMGTLLESYPREAKYYKPGSRIGKRPQLVWERLWTTTNGEYGNKQFTTRRPMTKGQLRNEIWKSRATDTTYKEYGQTGKGRYGSVAEQRSDQWERSSEENIENEDKDLSIPEETHLEYKETPSVTPPARPSPPCEEICAEPAPPPVRFPPIAKTGSSPKSRLFNKDYILSGVGKAYLEHSMGRYWDIMRTSNIKC